MDTPSIPIGLGTKVGLSAAAAQFVACLVTVFLDGNHSQETILTLVTATVTLITVLGGRYAQATAAVLKTPRLAPVAHSWTVSAGTAAVPSAPPTASTVSEVSPAEAEAGEAPDWAVAGVTLDENPGTDEGNSEAVRRDLP